MPKVSPTQNNFTAGELSPWLYGRFDISKYSNAAKTLENILIHQAGGGQRRPGSKYVAEVETSLEKTRLVTFEFSTTQAYILEFGNEYIRFYRNNGQIVYELLTTGATTGGDFAAGETLTGAESGKTCIVVAKVTSITYRIKHRTGTFTAAETLATNGKSAAYSSVASSTTPAEITTPYLTEDLFDLQFAQDADTMWIVHPNWKPRKLTRTAHDDWTLIDYTPELMTLDTAASGNGPWAVGDTIRGVTSGETCIIIEVLTDKTFNIKDRTGTFTDAEELTNESAAADQGAGYPSFTLDPFGADASDDCPSCVAMFEQRIYFANTNNDPQKIWGSVNGYFDNMTVGTNAGDAFIYVIASDKVNAIRWLKPGGKGLMVGTLGATFSMTSGTEAAAITPTNVSIKRDTTYGAANILPEMIGQFIYYVDRDLNHLRELGFSFDIDAQQALDMTILSDHIAKAADPLDTDGFTQIAYQQSPVSRLWCVRNDGQLAVLTRQIDQEVIGWSRQVSGSDSLDNGVYESVAIIPTDGGDDEVWVIVKRYIGGEYVRYIEYFMPERFDHQQDAFFVDSGLSLDSPKTITDIVTKTPIDDMEYASDVAAQTAYVSNDATEVVAKNYETDGNSVSAVGQAGDGKDYWTGVKIVLSAGIVCSAASIYFEDKVGSPTGDLTLRIETDVSSKPSGSLAHANATGTVTPSEPAWNKVDYTPFWLPAGTYWKVAYIPDQAAPNYFWHFTHKTAGDTDYTAYSTDDGASWALFDINHYYRLYGINLQCFSEDAIIQQGTYSLKAIAVQTESLNDTLTKTLTGDDKINLTGSTSIKLSVRASRTGSNFKIGFHDSGGVTTEHTVNIAVADTWQTETIVMSGVDNDDKDDIDSIIITILDADAENIFYIDNIYSPTDYITVTAEAHGFSDDDEIKIVDIVGMTELNNRSFVVADDETDTFSLKDSAGNYIDGVEYIAYISGGEVRKKVTEIEGLTHLAGEEVTIIADGLAVANKIVNSDGEITLDAKASLVHVGLPYISDIRLLPYPEGSATGTAIGKVQRTYKLIIKFYQSLGVQYGPDVNHLDAISETELFTGDRIVSFPGDWSRESSMLLRQSDPLPLNILSVTRISDVSED